MGEKLKGFPPNSLRAVSEVGYQEYDEWDLAKRRRVRATGGKGERADKGCDGGLMGKEDGEVSSRGGKIC